MRKKKLMGILLSIKHFLLDSLALWKRCPQIWLQMCKQIVSVKLNMGQYAGYTEGQIRFLLFKATVEYVLLVLKSDLIRLGLWSEF